MDNTKILKFEESWLERYPKYDAQLNFEKILRGSRKHLDFGCRIGTFTKMLAERFPHIQVHGFDIDKDAIKIANQRYNLTNLSFSADEKSMKKYDSISVFLVLHELVGDVNECLKSLFDHLNKNGIIIIRDFRKRSRVKFKVWYDQCPYEGTFEEEYEEHNKWTIKEFRKMCEKASFKTIKSVSAGDYWLYYIGKKS